MRHLLFMLLISLCGCNLSHIPDFPPSDTPLPPINTPAPDDWQTLAVGLEKRIYRTDVGFIFEAIRIDPTMFSFRAHYRPGDPLGIEGWREQLTGATIIINANFFSTENEVLGLLISDGIAYGRSYSDRGGTFFVQNGNVGIRSNISEPYRGEAYEQAIQAFPMLVYEGQAAYDNNRDTLPSRRTIIGQDAQGRVIIMVTTGFGPGLYDLSQYLATTDIGFVNAFNLDGGGSTMMYRATDNYTLYSFDPVPAVLAIYPK